MNTKHLFVCYFTILLVFGCDKTSEPETFNNSLVGSWNIINISGGFAGVDDDFAEGIIVWKFNEENSTLIIQNGNEVNTIYDGLESGNYTYSIIEVEDNAFLVINESEFGAIVLANEALVIDQNKMSVGSGADKFVLKFQSLK